MRFIVTGGLGFIGSALTDALRKKGHDVIIIDRKQAGEAGEIEEVLSREQIDGVYHLAAQTSVFNNELEQIAHDNILTFIKVVNACNKYKVRLIYASSSTANECNTTSMYGMSKRFNEEFAERYCKNCVGVRLHNVYGPNPREGTLLWVLMHEKQITIYNNGNNSRHFTFISDVVEGLIFAYGTSERLINIANPEENTVAEFVGFVGKYHALNIEYVAKRRKRDNSEQRVNNEIFCVPLSYTSVSEGIKLSF